MDADFYQQYKAYSNVDLLRIVKCPDSYQPAAVAAAAAMLEMRDVTAEEINTVDLDLAAAAEHARIAKKEQADAIRNKASNFFEPVLQPVEHVETNRWINLLLLVMAVQYAVSLYGTVKGLIALVQCSNCRPDITHASDVFTLLYVPVILFLVWKRSRWGWILLFADNLFTLISRLSQSYIFIHYHQYFQGSTTSFVGGILIKLAFVAFLWRDATASHFGVSQQTKMRTTYFTVSGVLLFIFLIFLSSLL